MGGLAKDARAAIGWAIDWGARGGCRRVTDCQWRITPDEPGGIRVTEVAEGSAVLARISGGRAGASYRIEARARLSDGTIACRAIALSVGGAA